VVDVTSQAMDPAAIGDDVVILVVPANTIYLAVLRTATAGMAARLQMTLDEIEDLRIAVDEACGILLPIAANGSDVTCRFAVTPESLSIDVSVPTNGAGKLPGGQSFSWQVLTALAGQVASEQSDGAATIHLTKQR
jgi:serine/threonine-protein kinase RsbW